MCFNHTFINYFSRDAHDEGDGKFQHSIYVNIKNRILNIQSSSENEISFLQEKYRAQNSSRLWNKTNRQVSPVSLSSQKLLFNSTSQQSIWYLEPNRDVSSNHREFKALDSAKSHASEKKVNDNKSDELSLKR